LHFTLQEPLASEDFVVASFGVPMVEGFGVYFVESLLVYDEWEANTV